MVFESAACFVSTNPSNEDVEREIKFHKDFIRSIEEYRNARLLSVSKLPSDVLSSVFEFLALSRDSRSSISTWLPATQLCRWWRDITLDTPLMWGCIYDDMREDIVKLCLRRSGSAPLRLRSSGCHTRCRPGPVVLLLEQHANRLREIDLRNSSWTCFLFDVDTPLFKGLHTLRLQSIDGTAHSISVPTMLRVLRKMEVLETLELTEVLTFEPLPDGFTAVLPRLTILRIETYSIKALAFLNHISCPNIQTASVRCCSQVGPGALEPVASAFYSLIPKPSSTWRTVLVSAPTPSKCRVNMNIWQEVASGILPEDPPFQISVIGPPTFETDLILCSALPTLGPSVLDFQDIYRHNKARGIDYDALRRFLRALDSVEEAYLHHFADILTILGDTPSVARKFQFPSFSLPSLRHIIWDQWLGKHDFSKLEEMLAARRAINAGIETLHMYIGPHEVDEDDIAPLRKVVRALEFRFRYIPDDT